MANTFKQINFAQNQQVLEHLNIIHLHLHQNNSIIGLMLCNIHTTSVTTEVQLVSTTSDTGGANNVKWNIFFSKRCKYSCWNSTLELLTGGKVVLQATDVLKIDCSVADKLSGSLSVLEIT